MPSIELNTDELDYLRVMMATALLQFMSKQQDGEVRKHIAIVVAINEALKNAKH